MMNRQGWQLPGPKRRVRKNVTQIMRLDRLVPTNHVDPSVPAAPAVPAVLVDPVEPVDLNHALCFHALDDVSVSPPHVPPRQASLPAPTGTPRAPLPPVERLHRRSLQLARSRPEVPELARTSPPEAPEAPNRYARQLHKLRQIASQVYVEPALPPGVEDLTSLVRRGALPSPGALPSVIGAELAIHEDEVPSIEEADVPSMVLDVSPLESQLQALLEPELRPPRPWWLQRRALVTAAAVAALGVCVLVVSALVGADDSRAVQVPAVSQASAPAPAPAHQGAPAPAEAAQEATATAPPRVFSVDLGMRISRSRTSLRRGHRRWNRRSRAVDVDALLTSGQPRSRAQRPAPRRSRGVLTAQVDVDALLTEGSRPRVRRSRRAQRRSRTVIPAWAR